MIKSAPNAPDDEVLVVSGGFMEVLPDRVTVLADAAEHAEDISEQQAEEARRRAAEAMEGEVLPEEAARMQMELEMAEARLRLARIRRRGA